MGQLSNISVSKFREFLISQGLSFSHTNGGHEVWKKPGMIRPVIFQNHVEPVPEFVVRNNLRTIGVDRKTLIEFLEK